MKSEKYYQRRNNARAYFFYALLTIAMLLAASCGKDDDTPYEPCECTAYIQEAFRVNLEIVPGDFYTRTLDCEDAVEGEYWLYEGTRYSDTEEAAMALLEGESAKIEYWQVSCDDEVSLTPNAISNLQSYYNE